MEVETKAGQEQEQERTEPLPRPDPKDAGSAMPPDAPEALRDAVREERVKEIGDDDEKSALDYLLGQQAPPKYKVPIKFDTPAGLKELDWHIHSLDGKHIDKIEKANTDQSSMMGEMDDYRSAAEILRDATIKVVDPKSGDEVAVNDPKFTRGLADPADAIAQTFHWQSGVMVNLAGAVRRISGWSPDRVGEASRVLAVAAGNS
jgi:hypothetical protein